MDNWGNWHNPNEMLPPKLTPVLAFGYKGVDGVPKVTTAYFCYDSGWFNYWTEHRMTVVCWTELPKHPDIDNYILQED